MDHHSTDVGVVLVLVVIYSGEGANMYCRGPELYNLPEFYLDFYSPEILL